MLGGGTPPVAASLPPPTTTTEVLVAARDIGPGFALDASSVRWEAWPKTSVSDSFIKQEAEPDLSKAVQGVVVRQPLVAGEPILENKIVRTTDAAGFLSATIKPGMRAFSLPVTADTTAGGFILPNDRVDVILTRDVSRGDVKAYATDTILRDVRVLAIDQAAQPEKDQKTVVGKTATLELSQEQSERLAEAVVQARVEQGAISLALRALGDSNGEPETVVEDRPAITGRPPQITVFRYGITRDQAATPGAATEGRPQ
jgi:pilus assembly protein CpaB